MKEYKADNLGIIFHITRIVMSGSDCLIKFYLHVKIGAGYLVPLSVHINTFFGGKFAFCNIYDHFSVVCMSG